MGRDIYSWSPQNGGKNKLENWIKKIESAATNAVQKVYKSESSNLSISDQSVVYSEAELLLQDWLSDGFLTDISGQESCEVGDILDSLRKHNHIGKMNFDRACDPLVRMKLRQEKIRNKRERRLREEMEARKEREWRRAIREEVVQNITKEEREKKQAQMREDAEMKQQMAQFRREITEWKKIAYEEVRTTTSAQECARQICKNLSLEKSRNERRRSASMILSNIKEEVDLKTKFAYFTEWRTLTYSLERHICLTKTKLARRKIYRLWSRWKESYRLVVLRRNKMDVLREEEQKRLLMARAVSWREERLKMRFLMDWLIEVQANRPFRESNVDLRQKTRQFIAQNEERKQQWVVASPTTQPEKTEEIPHKQQFCRTPWDPRGIENRGGRFERQQKMLEQQERKIQRQKSEIESLKEKTNSEVLRARATAWHEAEAMLRDRQRKIEKSGEVRTQRKIQTFQSEMEIRNKKRQELREARLLQRRLAEEENIRKLAEAKEQNERELAESRREEVLSARRAREERAEKERKRRIAAEEAERLNSVADGHYRNYLVRAVGWRSWTRFVERARGEESRADLLGKRRLKMRMFDYWRETVDEHVQWRLDWARKQREIYLLREYVKKLSRFVEMEAERSSEAAELYEGKIMLFYMRKWATTTTDRRIEAFRNERIAGKHDDLRVVKGCFRLWRQSLVVRREMAQIEENRNQLRLKVREVLPDFVLSPFSSGDK